MERKLNEQWIEELDGKKHMYKAVDSGEARECEAQGHRVQVRARKCD